MIKRVEMLTANKQYINKRPLQPSGIVVHSTGVNQKKISAYWHQFNTPTVGASVHGFLGIDDTGLLCYTQTLPYNIRCAGCGSGWRGSYNASHIQFEICEDKASKAWTDETYIAALDICEELCIAYGISPDRVVCHSEAHALGYGSNHADVMHWWPMYGHSMEEFRADLKSRLEDNDMAIRFKTINDVPASLRKETQELIDVGALAGKGGDAGLDVTEDMLRSMIIMKRYIDKKE